MDKEATELREAVDRYNRLHETTRRLRGWLPPSSPGFEPPNDEELAAMDELVSAIQHVRRAQNAWVEAGRPPLA